MASIKLLTRREWKQLGPDGRQEELKKFAFKNRSCSGRVELRRESLLCCLKRMLKLVNYG